MGNYLVIFSVTGGDISEETWGQNSSFGCIHQFSATVYFAAPDWYIVRKTMRTLSISVNSRFYYIFSTTVSCDATFWLSGIQFYIIRHSILLIITMECPAMFISYL